MNEKISCEVIVDLLPLCSENLCSEESRKLIEAHVRTCENCRRLYEQTPVQKPEAIPDESEAFRKVNKRMKRSKRKNILLTILVLLLLPVVILTKNMFIKGEGMKSFETLAQSLEVRKIAKMIAEGDFEAYMDNISTGRGPDSINMQGDVWRALADISKTNLEHTYAEAVGNSKVKSIRTDSCYTQISIKDARTIVTYVTVTYDDGKELSLGFFRDADGLYNCGGGGFDVVSTELEDFYDCLNFANNYMLMPKGWVEILMERGSELAFTNFVPEHKDTAKQSFAAFLEKGYTITNCICSDPHFDEEKGMLYYEFSVNAEDAQGSAILQTRIYMDYRGLYPPAETDSSVFKDGCSEELAKELRHIFG